MHKIENEFLKVTAREAGAELISIYDKRNKIERLWQADDKIWPWHSPVLFPVVGCCLNDEIIVDGHKYGMAKHGFARWSNFKLQELAENTMTFVLNDNAETLKTYPYRFEFLVRYHLKGNALMVNFEVRNPDNNTLYFCVGGHPAFNAPLFANEKYEDYYLEFEQNETVDRYLIDTDGFFDGRKEPVLNNSNKIQLRSDMFKDDAYIFKDLRSRKVTLKSDLNPHYLSVSFNSFEYLGIWAKVNAPYICIEPWLGCADAIGAPGDFKNKEGIISVVSKGEHTTSFTVEVG